MSVRGTLTYRKVFLESMAAPRLLDELFGRLLADLDEGTRALAAGDAAAKGRVLGHGLSIVDELLLALDHDGAPALCAELFRLYVFVREQLVEANVRCDATPLANARRVLLPLREAFQAAAPGAR